MCQLKIKTHFKKGAGKENAIQRRQIKEIQMTEDRRQRQNIPVFPNFLPSSPVN
jgi:hypothetical protein